ncbi:unnamed protein product [Durusdinium trenchii]|uniref:Uncharacterized protein n=1 Tax=Durusdinium trenchii TaxID=1381693 RepID=A0ABP0LZN6_9DINO
MPFDTVDEQYVRQRKILVCERCRRPMDGVQNRAAYQTGGSIAGSLGGSMGGSMLAGAVLGPVGALAGAIGGAIAGSRAGAAASEGICDAVDSSSSQVCEACKEAAATRRLRLPELGGGRLGAPGEAQPIPATSAPAEGPSVGERIGETAASAGKYVGEAASSVGESLSGMGSWVRKSVTSLGGSEEKKEPKKEAFKAFEGLRGFWWSRPAPGRRPRRSFCCPRGRGGSRHAAGGAGTRDCDAGPGCVCRSTDGRG